MASRLTLFREMINVHSGKSIEAEEGLFTVKANGTYTNHNVVED
jgi:hypothetical protein